MTGHVGTLCRYCRNRTNDTDDVSEMTCKACPDGIPHLIWAASRHASVVSNCNNSGYRFLPNWVDEDKIGPVTEYAYR